MGRGGETGRIIEKKGREMGREEPSGWYRVGHKVHSGFSVR